MTTLANNNTIKTCLVCVLISITAYVIYRVPSQPQPHQLTIEEQQLQEIAEQHDLINKDYRLLLNSYHENYCPIHQPFLQKMAKKNHPLAQVLLGHCERYTNKPTDAVIWYRKAAEQGDVRGQTELGHCYRYGIGVNIDYALAEYWYQKAAEQNDKNAQYNLAKLYETDYRNYPKAMAWYDFLL